MQVQAIGDDVHSAVAVGDRRTGDQRHVLVRRRDQAQPDAGARLHAHVATGGDAALAAHVAEGRGHLHRARRSQQIDRTAARHDMPTCGQRQVGCCQQADRSMATAHASLERQGPGHALKQQAAGARGVAAQAHAQTTVCASVDDQIAGLHLQGQRAVGQHQVLPTTAHGGLAAIQGEATHLDRHRINRQSVALAQVRAAAARAQRQGVDVGVQRIGAGAHRAGGTGLQVQTIGDDVHSAVAVGDRRTGDQGHVVLGRRDQAQTDAGAALQAHVATGGDETLNAVSARRGHGQRRACQHIHGAGAVDRAQQRHVRQRTCRCRGANRQAIGAGVQPAASDQFQVDAIASALAATVDHQHHTRTGSGRNAPGGTQLQQRLRQRADPRTGGLHAASNGNQFSVQRNAFDRSDADAGVHQDIAASIEHRLTGHRNVGCDREVGRDRQVRVAACGGGDAGLAALHRVHAATGVRQRKRHVLETGDGQARARRQVRVRHINTPCASLERPVQHRYQQRPVHRTDAATGGDAHSLGLHIPLGRLAIHIARVSDQRHVAIQGLHVVHSQRRTGAHIDLSSRRSH